MATKLEKAKEIVKANYKDAQCGICETRNFVGIRTVEQYLAIPHFRRRKLRGMTPLMSLEIDRKLRDYHPRRDPPKVEVAEQMSIFNYMGGMT